MAVRLKIKIFQHYFTLILGLEEVGYKLSSVLSPCGESCLWIVTCAFSFSFPRCTLTVTNPRSSSPLCLCRWSFLSMPLGILGIHEAPSKENGQHTTQNHSPWDVTFVSNGEPPQSTFLRWQGPPWDIIFIWLEAQAGVIHRRLAIQGLCCLHQPELEPRELSQQAPGTNQHPSEARSFIRRNLEI